MLLLLSLACAPSSDDTAAVDDTAATGPTATMLIAGTDLADAAPSPDGSLVYYTGPGGSSIEAVDATGASVGSSGAMFTRARGLVVDPTGLALYVADPDAGAGVETMPAEMDEAPTTVPGTEGYAPNAVAVVGSTLYYTGFLLDADGGSAGAWSVPVGGGEVSLIIADLPTEDPSGIAVAPNGNVFVAGLTVNGGTIWEVSTGAQVILLEHIALGDPAGIAMSPDYSSLLISSLDDTGHAQVLIYNLADGTTSTWNGTIGDNTAAGGLHQSADDPNQYAWCGVTAGVYHVGF